MMAPNVRCAGRSVEPGDLVLLGANGKWMTWTATEPLQTVDSCGWEAHRYGWVVGYDLQQQQWKRRPITDKPCPRCGGRVELIPQRT